MNPFYFFLWTLSVSMVVLLLVGVVIAVFSKIRDCRKPIMGTLSIIRMDDETSMFLEVNPELLASVKNEQTITLKVRITER